MSSLTELAPHFFQDASERAGAAEAVASTQQQTRGQTRRSSGGLGSSVHRAFSQSPLHCPDRKEPTQSPLHSPGRSHFPGGDLVLWG